MTSQQADTLISLLTTLDGRFSLLLQFNIAAVLVWLALHQFSRFFGR